MTSVSMRYVHQYTSTSRNRSLILPAQDMSPSQHSLPRPHPTHDEPLPHLSSLTSPAARAFIPHPSRQAVLATEQWDRLQGRGAVA